MPRFHILSDLHLEFGDLPERPRAMADLTILAGDIYTKNRAVPWPDAEEYFGNPVIMLAGNHEYYNGKIDTSPAKLRAAAAAKRGRFMDNEELGFGGGRILACTLWTDFKLFGDDLDQIKEAANYCVGERYGRGMNDFRLIRVAGDAYRRFRPLDAARLHKASVAWLEQRLAEPFDGPTMVVTHHAPSIQCVPEHLRADRLSCAYASRLEWLIERYQPQAWFYGHIHDSPPEFMIGQTRMLSNARGNTPDHLNRNFQINRVIEL